MHFNFFSNFKRKKRRLYIFKRCLLSLLGWQAAVNAHLPDEQHQPEPEFRGEDGGGRQERLHRQRWLRCHCRGAGTTLPRMWFYQQVFFSHLASLILDSGPSPSIWILDVLALFNKLWNPRLLKLLTLETHLSLPGLRICTYRYGFVQVYLFCLKRTVSKGLWNSSKAEDGKMVTSG